jgi:hypothetical protein
VCGTPDLNYAEGDEVDATQLISGLTNFRLVVQGANATSAFFLAPFATAPNSALLNKTLYTTANITPGSWKMRCYAWRGW